MGWVFFRGAIFLQSPSEYRIFWKIHKKIKETFSYSAFQKDKDSSPANISPNVDKSVDL